MAGASNFLGGYQIVREIARSNDIVYEARDPAMNRRIALKELALPANLVGQERRDRIQRFYREARAAGSLSHPNIVTVFNVGEDNGRHFIAMEFLEGDTLRTLLQVGGPLPLHRAVEICAQICDALDYAHQHGIIHRDVKPDNIQILPDGAVKLTDFGIARLGFEPGITQSGQVFGTPSYMSPEQIAGKPVDQRSDVFSMGVVLYETLTGRKPFTGDSVVTITYNIMNFEPPPPPGVPPSLQQVLRHSMAKQPEQRYPSARQMAEELRRPPSATMTPFAATQFVPPGARVSSLPQSTDPLTGNLLPLGASGSSPASLSSPFSPLAPSPLVSGRGRGLASATGTFGAGPMTGGPLPGGAPPISPVHPLAPPLPALPPRRGVRDVAVRMGPVVTLIGLIVVLLGIAFGVVWALQAGYQGYENSTVSPEVIQLNDDAVRLLNQDDYRDAYQKLSKAIQETPHSAPLYSTISHNLGISWLKGARDAQQQGDLRTALYRYQQALPLLPQQAAEIQHTIDSIQLGLNGRSGNILSGPSPGAAVGSGSSASQDINQQQAVLSQSQDEYRQALQADAQGDASSALEHYQKSVELDPGASWATQAQQRINQLAGTPR